MSDAKILVVEDGDATSGGQSQKSSGQDALKKAGKELAEKLTAAIQEVLSRE